MDLPFLVMAVIGLVLILPGAYWVWIVQRTKRAERSRGQE